jgi:uncharacterized membrane protein YraQ (UPF0718 family)
MSVRSDAPFVRRLLSRDGLTSVSHIFVMEWAAIWRDLVGGLLIAGAIAAWVPDSFWQHFFLSGHPFVAKLWGPLVGPLVAVISFVCSIGNVPLAVVLWKGGISFGGLVAVISFVCIGLTPDQHAAKLPTEGVSWNYTSWLNVPFLLLGVALLLRFLRTGGWQMLAMMGGVPDRRTEHGHGHGHEHRHSGHGHPEGG